MGEYAEYELEREMYRGNPHRSDAPRRRKLVACPECGKGCRGQGGLMQHQNAKHGGTWTQMQINAAPREYQDGRFDPNESPF